MPDLLAIGLGGGTRIHRDGADLRIGPDSVGFRITQDSYLFGGSTLTASDVAVAAGHADFGEPARLPPLGAEVRDALWRRIQAMDPQRLQRQIGRASGRERGCTYRLIS